MSVHRSTIRLARCAPALVVALALSATACVSDGGAEESTRTVSNRLSPPVAAFPATAARQWMVNLGNSVKGDNIAPPVGARIYTYGSIAMYESLVHGMPGYRSLAGQLNGLDSLPVPDPNVEYDWPTVMAQTMHEVMEEVYVYPLRLFFEYTTQSQASLTSLGPVQIGFRRANGVSEEVIQNSIAYANELSAALVTWMEADGYRDIRFKGYVPPVGPQYWVPGGFSDTDKVRNPDEPYFGTLRPVVMTAPDECAPPPPAEWSTEPGSAMYQEAYTVYETEVNLTDEQREIARFWADGPGATTTPAGHWLALITKNVAAGNLQDAVEGYTFVGLGMMDAFLAVWQSKYEYNLLRPETYIRRYIDPTWTPFLPTPQFPEYLSGHSGISGAMGWLMDHYFGNGPVVDNTKLRRGFGIRNFDSHWDAAVEASQSRIYGGIHYPMAGSHGLETGRCVAEAVINRVKLRD